MQQPASTPPSSRPPPPRIEIEKEMDTVVQTIGGQRVLDILGTDSPAFSNADYWFEKYNVIAELKCITEDKSGDVRMRKAISALVNKAMDSGRVPDPGRGVFRIQSGSLPIDVQRGIYKILARAIRQRLKKANRQIKSTRDKLGLADAYGLVLLANDGNYALQPEQLMYAVDVALGNDFSAVESLIVFMPNMLSLSPLTPLHTSVWVPASREGRREVPDALLREIEAGWIEHVRKMTGEPIPIFKEVEHDVLAQTWYDQRVSRRIR
jgi:hypothetical protein